MSRRKVAILGGGPAGLAAAFGLSETEALRDQYDVTVYQVGWRVGGKCSTGRAGPAQRIEQNGTHYLFGCYDNAFAIARSAYQELERDGITAFGTYDDAFLARNLLVLEQFFDGNWQTGRSRFRPTRSSPARAPARFAPSTTCP